MVTGNEYIFDNIDEALKYALETEQRALVQDSYIGSFDIINDRLLIINPDSLIKNQDLWQGKV